LGPHSSSPNTRASWVDSLALIVAIRSSAIGVDLWGVAPLRSDRSHAEEAEVIPEVLPALVAAETGRDE
jgi:hypothetical protein